MSGDLGRFLAAIWQPGDVRELRALRAGRDGTLSGYFDGPDALSRAVVPFDGKVNLYVTLNPVDPALLARASNRVKSHARATTADKDVVARHWLYVDIDPVRPSELSSTDEERAAALLTTHDVRTHLVGIGWPAPIVAMSGNGYQLLYRIDLPNDPESTRLIEGVLENLARTFNSDTVKIDRSVGNASRIGALIGTMKVKGDSTPTRPHRRSALVEVPQAIDTVRREQLEACSTQPSADELRRDDDGDRMPPGWVLELLDANGIPHGEPKAPDSDGIVWIDLVTCPFHPEVADAPCGVGEASDGRATAHCFHARGAGKGWQEFKSALGLKNGPTLNLDDPDDEADVTPTGNSAGVDTSLAGDSRAAAHFAHDVGDIVRWDNSNNRWLIWDARRSCWKADASGSIVDLWRKVLERRMSKAMKVKDDDARNRMVKAILLAGTTHSRYLSGLALAKARLPIRTSADDWDADPWLLGVGNGVVDLRTGTLLADPKPVMVSRATRASFDPGAEAGTWNDFLHEVFAGPDCEEIVEWLQLVVGYSIVGMADEEVIVFAYGSGSNGKSTLLEALTHALGEYAGTLETEAVVGSKRGTGGTNEDTVALRGLRLAVAFEPPIGAHLNEKNLKRIASRDPLTGAPKYGKRQEWLPTHTAWLATNSLPTVTDPTDATWRRIIALPFLNQWDKDGSRPDLPPADVKLPERLRAERDGILAWAIRGAVRYSRARSLLPMPSRVQMAREDYRADEDTVARFVRWRVIDADERIGKRALHQAYLAWCDEEGIKPQNRANERDFKAAFSARYLGFFGVKPVIKASGGSDYWWPVAVRQTGIHTSPDPAGGFASRAAEDADATPGQPAHGTVVVDGGGMSPTPLAESLHGDSGFDSPPSTTKDGSNGEEGPVRASADAGARETPAELFARLKAAHAAERDGTAIPDA